MNIFALESNPVTAAQYHCDQHIHKMILESAQMLSSAAQAQKLFIPRGMLYRPAYLGHPCTIWACQNTTNMLWLCNLALELESIRGLYHNCAEHSATGVVRTIRDYLLQDCMNEIAKTPLEPFALAMPSHIKIDNRRYPTVINKYQEYYRAKHKQWVLDKGKRMTYKGRSIPVFMRDLIPEGISSGFYY